MPRRKQKSPCKAVREPRKRKAPELNGPEVEWSKEEKERLLQALHEDKCQNNWLAIKKHVGTRHLKQVKQYTEQLKAEQRASSGFVSIAPKDASPIQVWVDLAEKLKNKSGSEDVAEICIPQVMTIAAVEPKNTQQGVTGSVPNYQKIYTCLGQLLRGQPLPPIFPSDAAVLLTLLNGVEEKLVYCDVNEQVNFIRQTFREQSKTLEDEQLQNLVASLGSTVVASSSCPPQQGPSVTPESSKTDTEEGTPEGANAPDQNISDQVASNQEHASSSSQQSPPLTPECPAQTEGTSQGANTPRGPSQDTSGQAASNQEHANDQTKDQLSEIKEEGVKGRVLRPRREKTKTVEKKNQLASLNPFRVPVHLLNFDLKTR